MCHPAAACSSNGSRNIMSVPAAGHCAGCGIEVSSSQDAGLEEAQHLRLWVCLLQVIALGASAMQILGLALVGDGVNGALAGELRGQKLLGPVCDLLLQH